MMWHCFSILVMPFYSLTVVSGCGLWPPPASCGTGEKNALCGLKEAPLQHWHCLYAKRPSYQHISFLMGFAVVSELSFFIYKRLMIKVCLTEGLDAVHIHKSTLITERKRGCEEQSPRGWAIKRKRNNPDKCTVQ